MAKRGILNKLLGDRGERGRRSTSSGRGIAFSRGSRQPIGEIDLIALDGDTIVFVEVKTRSSHAAGHPTEAITSAKQRQLTRTALAWLKRKKLLDARSRFDVIAITWNDRGAPLSNTTRTLSSQPATGRCTRSECVSIVGGRFHVLDRIPGPARPETTGGVRFAEGHGRFLPCARVWKVQVLVRQAVALARTDFAAIHCIERAQSDGDARVFRRAALHRHRGRAEKGECTLW